MPGVGTILIFLSAQSILASLLFCLRARRRRKAMLAQEIDITGAKKEVAS